MKLYHYDGETGYLTFVDDAFNIDPLESEKQGKTVYTIPALATTIAPPSSVPEGKIAYFDLDNVPHTWKIKDQDIIPQEPLPPPPDTPPQTIPSISRRQFWQQLGLLHWIELPEALAFMQSGTLPAVFETAVQSLDQQDPTGILQFKARMAFMANEYDRDNTFVPLIGQLFNKSDEEIDALFLGASQAM